MKRILGAVSIIIGIATTGLGGLVADDGIGVIASPATPAAKEAVVPVEEKGAPPVAVPEKPIKPKAAKPEGAEPKVTKAKTNKPEAAEPKVTETKAAEPKAAKPKVAKAAKKRRPKPPPASAPDVPKTAETKKVKPAEKVVGQSKKAERDMQEAEAAAASAPAKQVGKAEKPSKHGERAFFVAAGRSRGSVEAITLGLEFFSSRTWFNDGYWYWVPYLELVAGYWEGDPGHTGTSSLHEGGGSVYARCIRKKQPGASIRPYADVGVGLHYITEDRIEGKELGRQWLAGSNAGVGLVLGEAERVDVGLRIRHLSNGGTSEINWGINHYMVRAAFRF